MTNEIVRAITGDGLVKAVYGDGGRGDPRGTGCDSTLNLLRKTDFLAFSLGKFPKNTASAAEIPIEYMLLKIV